MLQGPGPYVEFKCCAEGFLAGEVIVSVQDGTQPERVAEIAASVAAAVREQLQYSWRAYYTAGQELATVARLRESGGYGGVDQHGVLHSRANTVSLLPAGFHASRAGALLRAVATQSGAPVDLTARRLRASLPFLVCGPISR